MPDDLQPVLTDSSLARGCRLPGPLPGVTPPDPVLATVLFVDSVGSTRQLPAAGERLARLVDDVPRRAASAVERSGGEVVKWAGDEVVGSFGLPAGVSAAPETSSRSAATTTSPGSPRTWRLGT